MSGLTDNSATNGGTASNGAGTGEKRISRSSIAAVVFAAAGCLGWLLVVPFLDACQQGEQLARFFAALFNVIILSGAGGVATIMLIIGLVLSFSATSKGEHRPAVFSLALANLGFVIAAVVLLLYLPRAMSILH